MGESSIISIPFAGGLNQKTAVVYLDPTKNQVAIKNGFFPYVGQISKRYGLRVLGNTILPGNTISTAFTNPSRIATTKASGVLAFSDRNLYNYSEAKNALAGIGQIPNVQVDTRGIPGESGQIPPSLVDFGSSLRMAVYTGFYSGTSALLTASIYDRETGEIILQPTQLDTATGAILISAFVVGSGTEIAIVYGTAADIRFILYNIASNTFGSPVITTVAVNLMDACPFVGDPNGGFFILYKVSSNNNLVYKYYDQTGTLGNTTVVQSSFAISSNVSIYATFGASELIWIGYGRLNSTHHEWTVQNYLGDGSFTASLAATVLLQVSNSVAFTLTAITRLDATHAWQSLFLGMSSVPSGMVAPYGIQARILNTGTSVQSAYPMGFVPIARPLVDPSDGSVLMACGFNIFGTNASVFQSGQDTVYLMRFTSAYHDQALPMATVAPRIFDEENFTFVFAGAGAYPWMSCGGVNTLPAFAAHSYQVRIPDVSALGLHGNSTFEADYTFAQEEIFQVHELGDGAHIQTSVPMLYDGTNVFEKSFFFYPEGSYATLAGTSGGITGAYGYAVIYRRTDANGNVHKSAPYFLPIQTLTAGKLATLTMPLLSVSYGNNINNAPVYIDIYRTLTNGATYYLLNSVVATPTGQVASNQSQLFTTYGPDNESDASLDTSTILYTDGGVLDGVNPPSAKSQCTHNNRVWQVAPDGQTVWFTTAFQQGQACYYNEAMTFPINEGGDINSIFSLDANFVAFKDDSIWLVAGDGPALTGQGSDLSTPIKIASDVGALDWRSCVLTPKGILFRAQSGFYLLDRSPQIVDVGRAIQDTAALFPNVISATLVQNAQHVRFVCEGDSGTIVVVYDYLLDMWTTSSYDEMSADIVSSANVGGQYTLVTADGFLWQERLASDPQAWMDQDTGGTNHFVETSVTFPWVAQNGKQGYQRLQHIYYTGERPDDHGLRLDLAVNNNPKIVDSRTFNSTRLNTNPWGATVSFRPLGSYSKGISHQVTITDLPGDAMVSGQGAVFTNLSFEVQVIGNRNQNIPNAAKQ